MVCRRDQLQGPEVSFIVVALCESFLFDFALELVRQFGSSSLVLLDNAYEALEFFTQKKHSEGYFPSTIRYNVV
ncbi:hypothetical protein Fmac_028824 [Flemingia macrophylla]|uniref:Uncharacterized protein n=1 Tax=Flemingia macrophylla TaxID=520843 RepID=A0ABD1L8L6_9FABA